MPKLAFTLHHQAVVLFKPWFVWRSTASLTSSVSPVHMRSRSTSRFCLMLLMLSISWRTASAVLHTRKPTQNEKQDNNFVYSVLFSEYRISKMFFSLLMFHLKSWTNKHCDNLQHTAYKYYLIRNIFLGSTFICSKNECVFQMNRLTTFPAHSLFKALLKRNMSIVWLPEATCWPAGQTAGSDWGVQIGSSSPDSSSSVPHGHSYESDLPLRSPHSGDSYGLQHR